MIPTEVRRGFRRTQRRDLLFRTLQAADAGAHPERPFLRREELTSFWGCHPERSTPWRAKSKDLRFSTPHYLSSRPKCAGGFGARSGGTCFSTSLRKQTESTHPERPFSRREELTSFWSVILSEARRGVRSRRICGSRIELQTKVGPTSTKPATEASHREAQVEAPGFSPVIRSRSEGPHLTAVGRVLIMTRHR